MWTNIPDKELLEILRSQYVKAPFIDGVQWAQKRLRELNEHNQTIEIEHKEAQKQTSDEKKE